MKHVAVDMKQPEVSYLPESIIRAIADMYGVQIASFHTNESGYRNASHSFVTTDGRHLNFILYKREPGSIDLIKRTNALSRHIAAQGLPVRAPIDERILRVGQRYGSLYTYLDGETIPWEAYSMKHIKLLGYTLAQFHTASEDYSGELPDVEDVYEAIYLRMVAYFARQETADAMREKLHVLIKLPDYTPLLARARQLTPRIPLHMDMVRSNLLFQKDPEYRELHNDIRVGTIRLTGILDLEKAARGHYLFDVARTLAFLLVDCDKPETKVRKYFLDSGYQKRGECDIADSEELLEQLITLFLTYDFYKFLRQNPYESLAKNRHYLRTERILRERNMLQ